MKGRTAVALALGAALAGCPLPQPLPEYKEGTSVTPPRILGDGITVGGVGASSRAVILVPANCPAGQEPKYELSAQIHDTNNIEQVTARWFVNYSPAGGALYVTPFGSDTIAPDPNPLVLVRTVPPNDPITGAAKPWVFKPYDHLPALGTVVPATPPDARAGVLRVVELVVSNGFYPSASEPAGLPNRTPMPGFETQVYRWVFLTVPETTGNCVPATDPLTCVKCPPPPPPP